MGVDCAEGGLAGTQAVQSESNRPDKTLQDVMAPSKIFICYCRIRVRATTD